LKYNEGKLRVKYATENKFATFIIHWHRACARALSLSWDLRWRMFIFTQAIESWRLN